MTTVVDPGGTPAPIYNKSGTTLVTLAVSGNDEPAVPVDLVAPMTEVTIVLLDVTRNPVHGSGIIRIDAGADIGCVVEIYHQPTGVGSGCGLDITDTNDVPLGNIGVGPTGCVSFRKVSATVWRHMT